MSWVQYFEDLCRTGPSWMDYSNDRVQVQTLGTAIEMSGFVAGRRCLDVGCGQGQLVRMLLGLGAREVVGVDQAAEHVRRLVAQYPEASWQAGDISEASFRAQLGRFDLIYLLEVLQYLPVPEIFDGLWAMLAPGGRILATFPNEDCLITKKTVQRFDGRYVPPPVQSLLASVRSAPGLDGFGVRGFDFQEDQRLAPYALSSWTLDAHWPGKTPNRLQLVIQKQPGDAR
jgi:2-polyprenyl-3-methyl-5-hydroxy-6-metoxy-1,4-benzoquinol methylase